jgi:hypothetical protein
MPTVAIRIDMPPKGIEVNGDGSSPSDEQMAEEQAARQEFIDLITPQLESLPGRPSRRAGNVSNVQLLGANTWSELNHYLLLVSVDIGNPGVDLESVLPDGAKVEVIGSYGDLAEWPEPVPVD